MKRLSTQTQNILAANIRASLVLSPHAMADIGNIRTRAENDRTLNKQWFTLFTVVNKFIETTVFDKDINLFLKDLPEMELHNAIATLSYRLNSRGMQELNQHYREQGKLSLASTILYEYHKIVHGRIDVKYNRGKTSASYNRDTYYIGNPAITIDKKNSLAGITYEPASPKTKVKGKAGLKQVKLTARAKQTLSNGNSMQHRLCTDVNPIRLYKHMLKGNEYQATKRGEFLKGRKVGKYERKELIKDRLLMTRLRYREDINNYKMLINAQEKWNQPIYLEMKYEYRGRVNYINNNQILGPQTKMGKKMWESYKPRTLNSIDYRYIAFVIMSTIERCNPDNAVVLFEKDIEGNIAKFKAEAGDYLEEVYHNRVVKSYYDYLDGTPNGTYLFTDYTNSGGIRFSVGLTREPKAMAVCNLLNIDSVTDVHGKLREAFNKHLGTKATRNDIKKAVSQGITAGVSPASAVKKIVDYFLNEHGLEVSISKEDYKEIIEDVYGKTGSLFHEFNLEMNSFYDNQNSELDINTRDGFPARSIAYLKGHEMKIYYVSTKEDRNKNNDLKSITLTRDMPMLYIVKDGKWIAAQSASKKFINGSEKVVFSKAKDKGGLANTTHADDSVPVRAKIDWLASVGGSAIFIHDNDGACGMLQAGLLKVGQDDLVDSYEKQPFLMALESASKNSKRTINGERYTIGTKVNFRPGSNFMQA